jgi:hypothetical protein
VQWEDGIRAHATSKAITDDQIATAANTPEGNAFVQNMLAPRIKAEIEKVMAGQLNGTRSVRLDVTVKTFALASAVQRILIGGGRGMIADANLVDARTGAVIIANHDLRAVLFAGEGIVGTAVQAAIDVLRPKTLSKNWSTAMVRAIATGCCAEPDRPVV